MAVDIEIRGAEQLRAVALRLKAAGESGKGLRKELLKGIQTATKGAKEDVKSSWSDRMPHRGGLSSRPLRVATRTRTGGRSVGVRIVTTSGDGYSIARIDKGTLRHPVYGNRKAWVTQQVTPGVVTQPLEHAAPEVRREIVHAIDTTARKVQG